MADYIDKQAFNDAIREAVRKYPNTFYNGLEVARQIAHDMDAADVAPVRHGRWMPEDECKVAFHSKCSECGCFVSNFPEDAFLDCSQAWNFCPNCGAIMDKED